jgi:hypothetical protein
VSKLLGFAVALALLFGLGFAAGEVVGPAPKDDAPGHGGMQADMVRGLSSAEHGLRLVVDTPELTRGRTQPLTFRILDEDGRTVRDFDVEHTKRLHLIVARRDLVGFQHLHPRQLSDGSWTTPLRLAQAGSYRVFADFVHDGTAQTLATDVRVDGAADLQPLPAPAAVARDGAYEVHMRGLRFSVTRDGRPVSVEPYLGARGHLVALRDGDLAFLLVHPAEDRLAFDAVFPAAGRYRLFLQFKAAGRVHTVAFTKDVA